MDLINDDSVDKFLKNIDQNNIQNTSEILDDISNISTDIIEISGNDLSKDKNISNLSFESNESDDDINYKMLINSKTDIEAFLTTFNTKYNTNYSNLFDIFDYVDSILNDRNNGISDKGNDLNEKIQNDIEIESLKKKNDLITKQNTILKNTNETLNQENKSLFEDNKNLQLSLSALNESIETQLSDISLLNTQRNDLLNIVQKQNLIINKLYEMKQQENQNKTIKTEDEQQINDNNNKEYLLLSTIFSFTNNLPDSLKDSLISIRDDSSKSVKERITLIFQKLANCMFESYNENIKLNKNDQNNRMEIMKFKLKCNEILKLFEEELYFLQNILCNKDLQSIVSAKSEISFETIKSDLIKRYASLGKFVEDSIGEIDINDKIENTNIFEFLLPVQMDEKLEAIVNKFDLDNNIEERELFDFFNAQVYLNELLKNYISELHFRITNYTQDLSCLKQKMSQNMENNQEKETILKELEHHQKIENKIRKFINNYIEIGQESSIYQMIIALFNKFSKQNKQYLKENQKLKKEIKNFDQKEITKQFNEISEKYNELQIKFNQKEEALSQLIKTSDDNKKKFSDEIEENNGKLKKANEQIDSLTNQIRQFENVFSQVKSQRELLNSQIQKLQSSNKSLTERINKQNKLIKINEEERKSKEDLIQANEQIKNEKEKQEKEYENKLLQSQTIIEQIKIKNQNLLSEIETLNIDKKSIELKLKTIEAKMNNEKKSQRNTNQILYLNNEINNLKNQISYAFNKLSILTKSKQYDDLMGLISELTKQINNERSQFKKRNDDDLKLYEKITQIENCDNIDLNTIPSKIYNEFKKIKLSYDELMEETDEHIKALSVILKVNQKMDLKSLISLVAKELIQKSEVNTIALKQWEAWGKRVYGIIYESNFKKITSNNIRIALEEVLLSSSSNRNLFNKLESLRFQKSILRKNSKNVLYPKVKNNKTDFRNILIISIFVHKLQYYANCLPIRTLDNYNPIRKS